jgi:hypothetical protein
MHIGFGYLIKLLAHGPLLNAIAYGTLRLHLHVVVHGRLATF